MQWVFLGRYTGDHKHTKKSAFIWHICNLRPSTISPPPLICSCMYASLQQHPEQNCLHAQHQQSTPRPLNALWHLQISKVCGMQLLSCQCGSFGCFLSGCYSHDCDLEFSCRSRPEMDFLFRVQSAQTSRLWRQPCWKHRSKGHKQSIDSKPVELLWLEVNGSALKYETNTRVPGRDCCGINLLPVRWQTASYLQPSSLIILSSWTWASQRKAFVRLTPH